MSSLSLHRFADKAGGDKEHVRRKKKRFVEKAKLVKAYKRTLEREGNASSGAAGGASGGGDARSSDRRRAFYDEVFAEAKNKTRLHGTRGGTSTEAGATASVSGVESKRARDSDGAGEAGDGGGSNDSRDRLPGSKRARHDDGPSRGHAGRGGGRGRGFEGSQWSSGRGGRGRGRGRGRMRRTDPFYKEKLAREEAAQAARAREDEKAEHAKVIARRQKRRAREHKLLSKRTAKGQPILKHSMTRLLAKIEAQVGAGEGGSHAGRG